MATNPRPSQFQMPASMKFFRSMTNHGNQKAVVGHAPLMIRDFLHKRDDFIATLDTAFWTGTNTGSGSATPILNAQANGAARFVAGTTNPSNSSMIGPTIFNSDDNPFMYVRVKLPAVITSSVWMEFGFSDIITTKTTEILSTLSAAAVPTLTNGMANGAFFGWNTGLTLTTPALVGVGTSIAVAGAKIANTAGTAYAPTAAKWLDVYVGCGVGYGYCEVYENDAFIGQFQVASGPDTATLMMPFLSFGSLGTAKTYDVDCVEILAERNTR